MSVELYNKVAGVVDEGQEYNQALIYETLGLKRGFDIALPAATPTTITLDQPYAAGIVDYTIWTQVKTSEDEEIGVVIIPGSQTEASFDVWVPKACNFNYITLDPSIDIAP